MIIICMECKQVQGEKEPLENKTHTHGLCFDCMPDWLMSTGEFTEAEAMKEVLRIKEKHNGNGAVQKVHG